MSTDTALIFKPGKPGREAGHKVVEVKAVAPVAPTLTGPIKKVDHMLDTILLWHFVGQDEDGSYVAYGSVGDVYPTGPETLAEARLRARFMGRGHTRAEARRALGIAVIQHDPDLQREFKPPRGSQTATPERDPEPESQPEPETEPSESSDTPADE